MELRRCLKQNNSRPCSCPIGLFPVMSCIFSLSYKTLYFYKSVLYFLYLWKNLIPHAFLSRNRDNHWHWLLELLHFLFGFIISRSESSCSFLFKLLLFIGLISEKAHNPEYQILKYSLKGCLETTCYCLCLPIVTNTFNAVLNFCKDRLLTRNYMVDENFWYILKF